MLFPIRIVVVGSTLLLGTVVEDFSTLTVFIANPASVEGKLNAIRALLADGNERKKEKKKCEVHLKKQ